MNKFAAVTVAFLAAVAFGAPVHALDRPPQFVAIAFDNCTELERWQELSDFAGELNKEEGISPIIADAEYAVWSPYEAYEAASDLTAFLEGERASRA